MVELLKLSAGFATTANEAFIPGPASTTHPSDFPEIEDTVTLSAAALAASRSSNLRAFPPLNAVVISQKAFASIVAAFPVEELIEEGYSASEVAIDLGLPAQTLEVDLGIPQFHSAA